MKKTALHVLLLSTLSPWSAYAMGLGNITVESYLGQPFKAEIELIDVGSTPLSAMQATLAPPQEFEKVGMAFSDKLSALRFDVVKNKQGQMVVRITSSDIVSEPYLQLLVDLAWPNGEIYRAYSVFLDPPNYQLMMVKKQLKQIVHRQEAGVSHEPGIIERSFPPHKSYGPTVAHETVWQIAERYKSEDETLLQLVLAIVGLNPNAFYEGNLNGLKENQQLQMPSKSSVKQVPITLAKEEVEAHDKAWQSRHPIEHVLMPPYITAIPANHPTESQVLFSVIPEIPLSHRFDGTSLLVPLSSTLLPMGSALSPRDQKKLMMSQIATEKASRDVAQSAVDAVRESNALLSSQLRTLQSENKRLHLRLLKREQQMDELQEQLRLLIHRQGMHGASVMATEPQGSQAWFWVLGLLILVGFAGGGYGWWYKTHAKKDEREKPEIPPLPVEEKKPTLTTIEAPPLKTPEPTPKALETTEQSAAPEESNVIEFVSEPEPEPPPPPIEPVKETPLKSRAALDTLLALAKSYILKDEVTKAKESLQEVMEFGNEAQQQEARDLLDSLKS